MTVLFRHADHSTRDVVMLLDDSDVSQEVEQCREVCRGKGTFLVDVNDLDSESRDNLRAFGSDGFNCCLFQWWNHQSTHVE